MWSESGKLWNEGDFVLKDTLSHNVPFYDQSHGIDT